MNGIRNWLKGKKTYIIAVLTIAGGVAQAFGVPIPAVLYPIALALGLGSLRAGVDKTAAVVEGAIKNTR